MGGHAIWVREGSTLLIPDLSPPPPPKKTCLDFDQDKNIAGQGKFLKPKRSGLGPIRRAHTDWLKRGKQCPRWGPAQAGFHPRSTWTVCVLQQAERHMEVCG